MLIKVWLGFKRNVSGDRRGTGIAALILTYSQALEVEVIGLIIAS